VLPSRIDPQFLAVPSSVIHTASPYAVPSKRPFSSPTILSSLPHTQSLFTAKIFTSPDNAFPIPYVVTADEYSFGSGTYFPFYSHDHLFAIYADTLFLIDYESNALKQYSIGSGVLTYVTRIPYIFKGSLYGITCTDASCTVHSAFHQEAGCDVPFNPVTTAFGKAVCADHTGDVIR
jgi:hypothetical protein